MTNGSTANGHTALDKALARLRASRAERLIPDSHRTDPVLDLGCGRLPVFLQRNRAALRVGLDHAAPGVRPSGARFVLGDVEAPLPFRTGTFGIVTMLAVLEHVQEPFIEPVLAEAHRVLKPGGVLVVTTPPPRTDRLLHVLERLRTVSPHMMEDHEKTFERDELSALFARTPFGRLDDIGYFELRMNIWATATKRAPAGVVA